MTLIGLGRAAVTAITFAVLVAIPVVSLIAMVLCGGVW